MNPRQAVLIMVVCTVFTSAGQILWKIGINRFTDIYSLLSFPMLFGFISYGLGAVLMLVAFKYGELSLLYPIIATSYVWVSILSPLFFADQMNIWKWAGVLLILLSVSLLGISSRKNNIVEKSSIEEQS